MITKKCIYQVRQTACRKKQPRSSVKQPRRVFCERIFVLIQKNTCDRHTHKRTMQCTTPRGRRRRCRIPSTLPHVTHFIECAMAAIDERMRLAAATSQTSQTSNVYRTIRYVYNIQFRNMIYDVSEKIHTCEHQKRTDHRRQLCVALVRNGRTTPKTPTACVCLYTFRVGQRFVRACRRNMQTSLGPVVSRGFESNNNNNIIIFPRSDNVCVSVCSRIFCLKMYAFIALTQSRKSHEQCLLRPWTSFGSEI